MFKPSQEQMDAYFDYEGPEGFVGRSAQQHLEYDTANHVRMTAPRRRIGMRAASVLFSALGVATAWYGRYTHIPHESLVLGFESVVAGLTSLGAKDASKSIERGEHAMDGWAADNKQTAGLFDVEPQDWAVEHKDFHPTPELPPNAASLLV